MKFSLRLLAVFSLFAGTAAAQVPSSEQLARWLKRFPQADTNRDGTLTLEEALAFRDKMQGGRPPGQNRGAPREFQVDPGWEAERFPEHAAAYLPPEELADLFEKVKQGRARTVTSFPEQENGVLRIVGTGHSFMAPGYRTLPLICRAAGFEQPLLTHIGGGITGSTRYKWEQENGIFEFDGKPYPKLLASIANAEWDAMMWGPYFNDRPEFYTCWIDFCLQYHPGMRFYLSDAWPQLYQLESVPESEAFLTGEVIREMGRERHGGYATLVKALRKDYPDKIFILPTSDAMVLAAIEFLKGNLPGIEGLHSAVGDKEERALWRDQLGHLGPGFERLEGYVFYATLYGKSPELIEAGIAFPGPADFPSPELDRIFRKIAWQAVSENPLSGVTDENGNGIDDAREEPAPKDGKSG